MMRYHSYYVTFYGKRDTADIIKVPNKLTLSESKRLSRVGLASSGEPFQSRDFSLAALRGRKQAAAI